VAAWHYQRGVAASARHQARRFFWTFGRVCVHEPGARPLRQEQTVVAPNLIGPRSDLRQPLKAVGRTEAGRIRLRRIRPRAFAARRLPQGRLLGVARNGRVTLGYRCRFPACRARVAWDAGVAARYRPVPTSVSCTGPLLRCHKYAVAARGRAEPTASRSRLCEVPQVITRPARSLGASAGFRLTSRDSTGAGSPTSGDETPPAVRPGRSPSGRPPRPRPAAPRTAPQSDHRRGGPPPAAVRRRAARGPAAPP
jgi:hypothetical protein